MPTAMTLGRRELALAGVACFVAWGYLVAWAPALRWAGHAFVAGLVVALVAVTALVLLSSAGLEYHNRPYFRRRVVARPSEFWRHGPPAAAAFIAPSAWPREVAALRTRQAYHPRPLYPRSPRVSEALDHVLRLVVRDFVHVWYAGISRNPVFENEVDRALRGAAGCLRDRLLRLDMAAVVTSRLVPLLTAHFRDFDAAERAVRGRKLNRSVTESDELDLAIAHKYRDGRLHPAAALAFSDTKTVQLDHLRRQVGERILPAVLPGRLLASRAAATLVREIVACSVLFPVMQMLSDPDTWNQLMQNYGRGMLQDRSTVRKLRAALDEHASGPLSQRGAAGGGGGGGGGGGDGGTSVVSFPRLAPGDGERRFEKFVRAIRRTANLSDARRFRSEVASQLKKDLQKMQQQDIDGLSAGDGSKNQVYLRRLDMGKRLLDQKVQHLAAGGDRRIAYVQQQQQQKYSQGMANGLSRLEKASLVDLLRDPAGMSYFMEYMDRQRLMPLVQFWLVVDGFRNPLEDDGPEGEQLPLQLPPWTDSDRLDLAQIYAAYLSRPELKVPESAKRIVQKFLAAGRNATPQQYYRARREILRAQSSVLEEMRLKHFQNFKNSDLFFKALASEEASSKSSVLTPTTSSPSISTTRPSGTHPPLLNRAAQSFGPRMSATPTPVARLAPRLAPGSHTRRAGSASDLCAMNVNGPGGGGGISSSSTDVAHGQRRSLDEDGATTPLFDDDELGGDDALADSVQSLDQDMAPLVPDRQVVQAMEKALNNILEDSQPPTAEEMRASLFGDDDAGSGLFSEPRGRTPAKSKQVDNKTDVPASARNTKGLVDLGQKADIGTAPPGGPSPRPWPAPAKEPEKPSLASLGLVSAASRIGVFEDDDLFGDEDRFLSDDHEDSDGGAGEDADVDAIHEAAPGDLGLAEAITALSNDIDRLVTQDAVVDSLVRKAELTNNAAELRILRKSKTSLEREIRRKELQRQQYVVQESDNSLYGRSTVRIKAIEVGREESGGGLGGGLGGGSGGGLGGLGGGRDGGGSGGSGGGLGGGKEFALYVVEVSRNAGERMPAATWSVSHRFSEFHELHHRLRSRYPSVRNLDFPRRRVVMKLQSEFLRRRRAALERYLSELLLLPDVCRSRELRAFLSQSSIITSDGGGAGGVTQDLMDRDDKKDMMTRLYDSVTDGVEDILGSIPVLDQLSLAGQNLIAAATSQLNSTVPVLAAGAGDVSSSKNKNSNGNSNNSGGGLMANAAEAEAELNVFDQEGAGNKAGGGGSSSGAGGDHPTANEAEPFVKPICDVFLEVFELNKGNNWLRGRAVVVVLHQLLGGTIERKLRDNVRLLLLEEEAVLRLVGLVRDAVWPGGTPRGGGGPGSTTGGGGGGGGGGDAAAAAAAATTKTAAGGARTAAEMSRTKMEASLMLATLLPDLAGGVVGRMNAQAASRRIFATLNNARLNTHLAFTFLDQVIDILFDQG